MKSLGMRPCLSCPECGEDVISAECRGRNTDDFNFVKHKDECRCRWCDWMWFDDQEEECPCGVTVYVVTDDGMAWARVRQ